MGRSCPIDFKLGRTTKYDIWNPLPVQEGHIDMISLIIMNFVKYEKKLSD